ncbi:FUSC family protein [Cohnella nanjingensis]|uniref:FUSC family protein n=1 Tax=Cohnella nanjingensis TaxID=1387779 RepID=A0A7X0RW30_9BACL|nr:FUSC family protein [Cohnella nanjingensis]MBB6674718.1 FUSC family protein [Cohnella nanjingensis]
MNGGLTARKEAGRDAFAKWSGIIGKLSFASGLAWALAHWAGSKHPFLAPVSVILCMQTTVLQSLLFSYRRLGGTILGVGLTMLAVKAMPLNGWTLAALLAGISCIALLVERNEIWLRETALSGALVFELQRHSEHYAVDRLRDTAIGVAVAMIVMAFVLPPNETRTAERALQPLADRVTRLFGQLAAWTGGGCGQEQEQALRTEIKTLRQDWQNASKTLQQAADGLRYNPFRRKSERRQQQNADWLEKLRRGINYLEKTEARLRRGAAAAPLNESERSAWQEQFDKLGGCWGQSLIASPSLEPLVRLARSENTPLYLSALLLDTNELLEDLKAI